MSDIFKAGRTAVIFGGANGIGLAAAMHCAGASMPLVIVDVETGPLGRAASRLAEQGAPDVRGFALDVGDVAEMRELHDAVMSTAPDVSLVMNNAGRSSGGAGAFSDYDKWRAVFDTNFWGVMHGMQTFAPTLIAQKKKAAIVNTGSKQGLTNPPGDFAYNATKSALRTATEGLAYALRNTEGCEVSAHLLIPGFTYTGLVAKRVPEKPAAAWTPEQVVERMVEGVDRSDFYILCPDNETTQEMDALRLQWAAADIAGNRPALSRWHPDFKDAFAAYMKKGGA